MARINLVNRMNKIAKSAGKAVMGAPKAVANGAMKAATIPSRIKFGNKKTDEALRAMKTMKRK